MSLSTDREAIAAKLEEIANIGAVHRFERYAKSQKDFRAFFENDGKVLGWFVRRRSTRELEVSSDHNKVITTWDIRGYMSLDDDAATEIEFDTLIENGCAVFRNDITVGGAFDTTIVDGKAGLQVDDTGPVMFSGVLCHGARLSLMSLMTECTVEVGATATDDFKTLHTDYDIPPHGNVTAPLPAAETDAEDEIQPEQDP